MPQTQPAANPFALMMDPEAIFAAIESSERLQRLKSRICRPLDEPRLAGNAESRADDEALESSDAMDAVAASEPESEAGEGSTHPASHGAQGAPIAS